MKKLKTFIAYRHTGENEEDLKELLSAVKEALAKAGVDSYCTFFDEEEVRDKSLNPHQIMAHAFSIIDGCDFLFVIQTSENKSEGMLMEVGYCAAKNIPTVIAIKSGTNNTYLPDMGKAKIMWSDLDDLRRQIEATDFLAITGK